MNICYATDDNFCMQTGVSILSVLSHCPRGRVSLYILDAGICPANQRLLRQIAGDWGAQISFLDARPFLGTVHAMGQKMWGDIPTYATWARLFLPELLPESVHRVLYLDGDVVAANDCSALFSQEMGGQPLAAVEDCVTTGYRQTLGLKPGSPYCNAGVLLIDMDAWRSDYCAGWPETWLRSGQIYPMADQDIINLMFEGRICLLPLRYNLTSWFRALRLPDLQNLLEDTALCSYTAQDVDACTADPVFVHYNTCSLLVRPWYRGATDPAAPLWMRCFQASPWASEPLEEEPERLSNGEKRDRRIYQLVGRRRFEPVHRADLKIRHFLSNLFHRRAL
ncbi:MAG: glycosyltransferase family 8 protein [Gemmiger sp.]